MKVVKYHGPHDAVEIEVAPALWVTVVQGGTLEVGDTLAAALLDQVDNWKLSKKATKAVPVEG